MSVSPSENRGKLIGGAIVNASVDLKSMRFLGMDDNVGSVRREESMVTIGEKLSFHWNRPNNTDEG